MDLKTEAVRTVIKARVWQMMPFEKLFCIAELNHFTTLTTRVTRSFSRVNLPDEQSC
jgi:hypothetical protein